MADVDSDTISKEDLQRMLDNERAEKVALQSRASTAERERDEARGTATSAVDEQYRALEEATDAKIEVAQSNADRLEKELAAAHSEARYEDVARIQREMSRAEATIERMTDRKADIAEAKALAKKESEKRPAPKQETFTPQTRAWINEHPQFNTDPKYHAKAMSAHYAALAEGLVGDSPAYFDFINAAVDGKPAGRVTQRAKAAETDPDDEDLPLEDDVELEPESELEDEPEIEEAPPARKAAAAAPAKRAATAAPVTRHTPQSPRNPRQITLTADEREAADMAMPDLPPAERYRKYHDNKQRLRASGRA